MEWMYGCRSLWKSVCPQGIRCWIGRETLVCLIPYVSLLFCAEIALPAGSLGMLCYSLLRLAFGCLGTVWTPLLVTIAQVLYLPALMSALFEYTTPPHFGLPPLGYIETPGLIYIKSTFSSPTCLTMSCYPFCLYCGYSQWTRDTLHCIWEAGHKSS